MAISVVGISGSSSTTGNVTSMTVPVPAHNPGDLIVAFLGYGRGTSGSFYHNVPTGFTERGSARRDNFTAFNVVFDRFDTAGTINSIDLTLNDPWVISGGVIVLRGVDPVAPVGSVTETPTLTGQINTLSLVWPSVVPAGAYEFVSAMASSVHTRTTVWTNDFIDLTYTTPSDSTTVSLRQHVAGKLSPQPETPAVGYTASRTLFWSMVGVTYLPGLVAAAEVGDIESSAGWTLYGSAASSVASMNDSNDATGIEALNSATAGPVLLKFNSMRRPTALESLKITLKAHRVTGISGSWLGELMVGGRVVASQTITSNSTNLETLIYSYSASVIQTITPPEWSSGVSLRITPSVVNT